MLINSRTYCNRSFNYLKMQSMNSDNYQAIVRDTIIQVFPRYDTSMIGQIPLNKLLPFTQQVFQILKAPPMTNQQWLTYSKDVDLNADGQLSKMELFFAIKTYFYKKIKIEKQFDYPDFDDIGKSPGYSNATQFDNRLKGVIDNTYQQHNQKPVKPEQGKESFGFVPKKQVTGFLNNCLNKMGVEFKVTEEQTNKAIDFLANQLGNKQKGEENGNSNKSTSNNNLTSNSPNYNQNNNNYNYSVNQNNNNNNPYNSGNSNSNTNQGADKMDIFMTIKNLFNK